MPTDPNAKPPVPPPTPEQLEVMRKKLVEDPNTAEIAKTVGMPYQEYIALVMKFAANPQLEPQVYVAEDADLRAAGFEPPDIQKIAAFIDEHVEALEVSGLNSKFADPNSQREKVSGKLPVPPAATAKPEEVKKDLKDELERERTSGKFRKF